MSLEKKALKNGTIFVFFFEDAHVCFPIFLVLFFKFLVNLTFQIKIFEINDCFVSSLFINMLHLLTKAKNIGFFQTKVILTQKQERVPVFTTFPTLNYKNCSNFNAWYVFRRILHLRARCRCQFLSETKKVLKSKTKVIK